MTDLQARIHTLGAVADVRTAMRASLHRRDANTSLGGRSNHTVAQERSHSASSGESATSALDRAAPLDPHRRCHPLPVTPTPRRAASSQVNELAARIELHEPARGLVARTRSLVNSDRRTPVRPLGPVSHEAGRCRRRQGYQLQASSHASRGDVSGPSPSVGRIADPVIGESNHRGCRHLLRTTHANIVGVAGQSRTAVAGNISSARRCTRS